MEDSAERKKKNSQNRTTYVASECQGVIRKILHEVTASLSSSSDTETLNGKALNMGPNTVH